MMTKAEKIRARLRKKIKARLWNLSEKIQGQRRDGGMDDDLVEVEWDVEEIGWVLDNGRLAEQERLVKANWRLALAERRYENWAKRTGKG